MADEPIKSTPGVMGGDACIRDTRIPVWTLVGYKCQGLAYEEILAVFPGLNASDLIAAWDFYVANGPSTRRIILPCIPHLPLYVSYSLYPARGKNISRASQILGLGHPSATTSEAWLAQLRFKKLSSLDGSNGKKEYPIIHLNLQDTVL